MFFSVLIISLVFIDKLNEVNTLHLQENQSRYYSIIERNKNVSVNSSNLLKSFANSNKVRCLVDCNKLLICNVAIYSSKGLCGLYKKDALNELIDADDVQETTVFQCQNEICNIMNGLTNFWPINSDLRDYIGSSDLITGPLDVNETIGFAQDRFNNTNGSIYMNPGYYIISGGLDLNFTFSFLVWVKALKFVSWQWVFDCANDQGSEKIVLGISGATPNKPLAAIYNGTVSGGSIYPVQTLQLNTWFHLAVVYDGKQFMMYLDGILVANSTRIGPNILKRTSCYVGRSNGHFVNGNPDTSACFDDLMLYSRALTTDEIRNVMNTYFN